MGLYDESGRELTREAEMHAEAERKYGPPVPRMTATEIARGRDLLRMSPLVERISREFPVLDDLRKTPPPRLVLEWQDRDGGKVRLVQSAQGFTVENLVPDSMGEPRWVCPTIERAFALLADELTRRVS